MEAGGTVPERAEAPELVEAPEPAAELDRIEAAVAMGNNDLRALGFWRVVERIKRDRGLVSAYADRVGRIDTAAFRARVRLRAPVSIGMLVLVAGAAVGLAALIVAANIDTPGWAGLLLLGAAGMWSVSLHCPTHWLVGWLAGIRFTDMFLGGPPPPRPGLKTDYATYLRAEPAMRAWFHASGAIATKLAPFVALAVWPVTEAPAWAAWGLLGLGAVLVATDLLFSVRSSDWKKFRRERAVARAILRDP